MLPRTNTVLELKQQFAGTWLAPSMEHATLDLGWGPELEHHTDFTFKK